MRSKRFDERLQEESIRSPEVNEDGASLGASHQTGWTGSIARAMHVFATSTAEQILELAEVGPARRGQSGAAAPSRKR